MKKSFLICALFVCLARAASAQTLIVETATFNNTDESQWGLSGSIAYGIPFHIDTTTLVTRVGVANLTGSGTFYAAIVRASTNGFPDGAPFEDGDVLGHAVFAASGGDQRIALSATLTPGDYTLVVGAGVKYGVSGEGSIGTDGQVHNAAVPVFYSFSDGSWVPVYGYYTAGPDPLRFVVEGASEHQAILDAVSSRASQASVDALATTAAALPQIATALAGKANESTVAALGTEIAALNSAVAALGGSLAGVATVGDVNTAAANVSTAVSTRASQESLDALAATLGASSNDGIAVAIERALADGKRVAIFFLPESVGGVLEQVRSLVDARLTSAQQAGIDVVKARAQFVKGDAAFSVADFKAAYDYYAAAYQWLIK